MGYGNIKPIFQDCLPFGRADYTESTALACLWQVIKRLSKMPFAVR
jgi:hypothetical protein